MQGGRQWEKRQETEQPEAVRVVSAVADTCIPPADGAQPVARFGNPLEEAWHDLEAIIPVQGWKGQLSGASS